MRDAEKTRSTLRIAFPVACACSGETLNETRRPPCLSVARLRPSKFGDRIRSSRISRADRSSNDSIASNAKIMPPEVVVIKRFYSFPRFLLFRCRSCVRGFIKSFKMESDCSLLRIKFPERGRIGVRIN